jgi:adenosylcobinamide kinase/adenosylcobinamide-phosphate guanylyltransferase
MLYLVTGGSASGKSEYAEQLAVRKHRFAYPDGKLYYIATMYPYDRECHARIKKHQDMRRDKGFSTIECYVQLEKINPQKGDVLLLECMSNLLANEMYQEGGRIRLRGEAGDAQLQKAVIEPVLGLARKAGSLIVVTNEVFSDGMNCEETMREYLRMFGRVNTVLAQHAAAVAEVVCSIPVCHKGKEYLAI